MKTFCLFSNKVGTIIVEKGTHTIFQIHNSMTYSNFLTLTVEYVIPSMKYNG